MKQTNRPLSLFLALLLSLTLILPSAALAARSTETEDFDKFLAEDCAQMVPYQDTNLYEHAHSDFPNGYVISEKYLNQVLSLATYSEQMSILDLIRGEWIGSCYGIATTMILSKSAKVRPNPATDLRIEEFQRNAQKYFDLTKPLNNPPVLDMINYYMCTQSLGIVRENSVNINLAATKDKIIDTKNNDNLRTFISDGVGFIDNDAPALFSFYYPDGGHAIILCDYFVKSDGIIFKLYDENDRSYQVINRGIHYAYLEITKDTDGQYKASNELVKMYTYKGYRDADGKLQFSYSEHDLDSFRIADIVKANEYLNIHDPKLLQRPAGNAEFTFRNIVKNYERYAIRPFIANGRDIMEPSAMTYADEIGAFLNNPEVSKVPFPYKVGTESSPHYYAYVEDFRYTAVDKDKLDLTLSHNAQGGFNGSSETIEGYDVITSCGKTADFYVSKEDGNGGGSFTTVEGTSIGTARFDASGRLRKIFSSCPDGASDVELLIGTYGSDTELDMVELDMAKMSYLEVYDKNDDASCGDGVVLHTDALPGGIKFEFYKGALLSGAIGNTPKEGISETWVKIDAKKNEQNEIEVSVWSTDKEPAAGTKIPAFDAEPDWSTKLHSRYDGGSNSSSNVDASYYDNQFSFLEGENGTWNGVGDYTVRVNAPMENYVSTSVDGVSVLRDKLTVTSGSTVVTLHKSYLDTLTPGVHRLRVQFNNGRAETSFTVGNAGGQTSAVPTPPATDGGTGLALLCFVPLLMCGALKRKNAKR